MPLVDIKHDEKDYYLNLKDKVLIEKKDTIINDVSEKYDVDNLRYYPSYDFLLMYEKSGINSFYVNMLANELFEPVYEGIKNKYNVFNNINPESVYANFVNHYDLSIYEIKKFTLFAKAVLNVINKKKQKQNKKSR